jgi:hypothetical protein
LALKFEDRVDAAFGIRTSVDVVAEEDDSVVSRDGDPKLAKEIVQCSQIAVDVTDRDRRHVT